MSPNDSLKKLYESRWDEMLEKGKHVANPIPTNPMLLSFDEDKFCGATKRIMICGQETWGWDGFGTKIDESMASYFRFFVKQEFYSGYAKSAFWKIFRLFERELPAIFENDKIQFIWQNLSKIGRNDGETGVTAEIRELERNTFAVLADELRILEPDIVIFLTGPDRDHDISFHFPDVRFEQAGSEKNLRRCAWLVSSQLPSVSLRLYHPSFFKAWTHQYRNEALALIRQRGEQVVDG